MIFKGPFQLQGFCDSMILIQALWIHYFPNKYIYFFLYDIFVISRDGNMAMGSLTSTIKLHLALWNIGRHYYTGENCEDVYCFCSVDVVFLIFSVVFVRFLVWFLFCFFFLYSWGKYICSFKDKKEYLQLKLNFKELGM